MSYWTDLTIADIDTVVQMAISVGNRRQFYFSVRDVTNDSVLKGVCNQLGLLCSSYVIVNELNRIADAVQGIEDRADLEVSVVTDTDGLSFRIQEGGSIVEPPQ